MALYLTKNGRRIDIACWIRFASEKRKNWKSRGIMHIFKYFVWTMFSKALWNCRAFFCSKITSIENEHARLMFWKKNPAYLFIPVCSFIREFRVVPVKLNLNWDHFLVWFFNVWIKSIPQKVDFKTIHVNHFLTIEGTNKSGQ